MKHIPVLLQEVLNQLQVKQNEIFVDMTLGGGGHTSAILESVKQDLTVIGLDADRKAIDRTLDKLSEQVQESNKLIFETVYFDELDNVLSKHQIQTVDKVLFDLGLSSFQLDEGRGFSFKNDAPLEMTFTSNPDESQLMAYDVVNKWEEESGLVSPQENSSSY